jgi:hypothetical protein
MSGKFFPVEEESSRPVDAQNPGGEQFHVTTAPEGGARTVFLATPVSPIFRIFILGDSRAEAD